MVEGPVRLIAHQLVKRLQLNLGNSSDRQRLTMIIVHRSTFTMVDDDIYPCLFEIYAVSRMTPVYVVILAQTVVIDLSLVRSRIGRRSR